jgi:hypothetical protein
MARSTDDVVHRTDVLRARLQAAAEGGPAMAALGRALEGKLAEINDETDVVARLRLVEDLWRELDAFSRSAGQQRALALCKLRAQGHSLRSLRKSIGVSHTAVSLMLRAGEVTLGQPSHTRHTFP